MQCGGINVDVASYLIRGCHPSCRMLFPMSPDPSPTNAPPPPPRRPLVYEQIRRVQVRTLFHPLRVRMLTSCASLPRLARRPF